MILNLITSEACIENKVLEVLLSYHECLKTLSLTKFSIYTDKSFVLIITLVKDPKTPPPQIKSKKQNKNKTKQNPKQKQNLKKKELKCCKRYGTCIFCLADKFKYDKSFLF